MQGYAKRVCTVLKGRITIMDRGLGGYSRRVDIGNGGFIFILSILFLLFLMIERVS